VFPVMTSPPPQILFPPAVFLSRSLLLDIALSHVHLFSLLADRSLAPVPFSREERGYNAFSFLFLPASEVPGVFSVVPQEK